jgi:hypothetical protein
MQAVMQQLASGQLNPATIIVWTVLAFVLSVGGGAAAGVTLAGKELGNVLAALMGAMFGPVAAAPGILVGLILLALL